VVNEEKVAYGSAKGLLWGLWRGCGKLVKNFERMAELHSINFLAS